MTAHENQAVLGRRARNRALLERQLLLRRSGMSTLRAVEHLVGLQGQSPLPPYVGLWSRLEAFDPHALGSMLVDRQVVRVSAMRATIHLLSASDALLLRPLHQVVLERSHRGAFGREMTDVSSVAIAEAVYEILASDEPLPARAIARRLIDRGIGADLDAVTDAIPTWSALAHVPPRGVWGRSGQPRLAPLERWAGGNLDPEPERRLGELVTRYLAAFGPASVLDCQRWSGLTRLRAVFDRLRPRLVTFRSEDGRELFDLPGAPRPDPDTPAPVRFLGEFDNVLLSHADRTHIVPLDASWRRSGHGRSPGHILVDGMVRAGWSVAGDGGRDHSVLSVRPFDELSKGEAAAVVEEGGRLHAFLAPDAGDRQLTICP